MECNAQVINSKNGMQRASNKEQEWNATRK